MTELENLYHLHLKPLGDPDAVELRLRARLVRGDEQWAETEHVLEVTAAVIARCGCLQRFPDDAPDVQTVRTGEGSSRRVQRDPQPDLVVSDLDTAAIDDIGAWLWLQLPACIRTQLARDFANPVRLLVHAQGTASVLPWHRLAAWDETAPGMRRFLATGRWDILMHVAGGDDGAAVAVRRRVLLLVGSQWQRPESDTAEHSVMDVVRAIRAAGFHCDVAAGRQRIATFEEGESVWRTLDDPDQLRAVIAARRPDIVHFMGHSDASQRADQSPLGAGALWLEIDTARTRRPLRIDTLAEALREASTRLVVLHACMTRERVAGALLASSAGARAGTVDAVVSMGGFAAPRACADFATAFYANFAAHGLLGIAAYYGRQALRDQHPGLDWLPLTWARCTQPVRLADDATERIERYCEKLIDRHDAFEGLFEELHGAMEHVAIDLDVQWAREAGDRRKTQRYQRILKELPPGERLHFAHLLEKGGWWTLGGEAGSGKTTTLRQHARALAKDRRRSHVPIFLPLASWLDRLAPDGTLPNGGLKRWIGQDLEEDYEVPGLGADLVRLGRAGKLVLLFDGLDELTPAQRSAFTGKGKKSVLGELHAAMATCRVVVATRRYQSAKRLDPAWFDDADVCPLERHEAENLLGNILRQRIDTQALVEERVEEFRRRVDRGQRLWQDVAQTPLLVSLLGLLLSREEEWPSSKVAFYQRTFDVLCRGDHKARPRPLPHADDALLVLRHVAGQMTVARVKVAGVAQIEAWLTSAAAPDVRAALGDTPRWLDSTEGPSLDQPKTACQAFLRRVATDTLLFGPHDESGQAKWRFWHRSFQEALCAMWLHERHVAGAASEAEGVRAVLAALDGWIGPGGGREPDAALVARHRAELEEVWRTTNRDDDNVSLEQRDIISEAWSAPTDQPVERDTRLSEAQVDWTRFTEEVLDEAARGRALREAQEPFTEALALLGDMLGSSQELVEGLLRRNWQLALRVALAASAIDPQSLQPLLAALPELGQRATVLDHVATSAREPLATLDALQARAEEILASFQARPKRGVLAKDSSLWLRHVWDTPGELRVLCDVADRVGDGLEDPQITTRVHAVDACVLRGLGAPERNRLHRHLRLVPGREKEPEPGRSDAGIRLWRLIPAGEFEMGSAGAGPRGDEVPHRVRIAQPFWIGAVPVTVGLYRLFSPAHEVWIGNGYQRVDAKGLDPAMAVTGVSHHAARMFCAWLQHHAGAELLAIVLAQAAQAGLRRPEAIEVRLPFEAEREYAARAGTSTRYFFGDDPQGQDLGHWAWFGEGVRVAAHPVASKRGKEGMVADAIAAGANAFGLFDVHGNVWEWCEDWYAERYPVPEGGAIRTDLRGPASGRFRVLRGGSAWDDAGSCRAAARFRSGPGRNGSNDGFRVVLAAVPRSNIDP